MSLAQGGQILMTVRLSTMRAILKGQEWAGDAELGGRTTGFTL